YSVKGIRTVARIRDLVSELKLVVDKQVAIINYAPAELAPTVNEELARLKIGPVALIPEDEQIYKYDLELKSLLNLPDTSKAVRAVSDLMTELLNRN
ncbi:carbon monoxide dehydrogenase, partial [Chloroflexota bacterium]